jgi:hypothetical protein
MKTFRVPEGKNSSKKEKRAQIADGIEDKGGGGWEVGP